MRYFQRVLQKTQGRPEPLELSVYCDVSVFQWLLGYCQGALTRSHIAVERVVSLLIASNFLQASL
ncbi:hypothetical protein GPECTOR_24g252 [Gonium pectorale]|uniref:SANT and BTB domain-containing protein n=1 Tax=Gonium pectorale TaxID=33097 RepID=A0A150GGJ9_GONPE|nr:hypothetical protein GPECTOR_24g252 [Gonium pectorale]|eukprot:KXZ48962.1 hypothetical protein GPECTOR_24g252 [Gonium pectorale]